MSNGKHNPYPSNEEAAALLNEEESRQNAEQFQRLAGYAQQQAAMNDALMRGGTPTVEYAPPVAYIDRPAVRSDAAVFALACRHLGYEPSAMQDELADICLLILRNRETVLMALNKLAADPAMENRIASTRRESRTGHILLAGLILAYTSA